MINDPHADREFESQDPNRVRVNRVNRGWPSSAPPGLTPHQQRLWASRMAFLESPEGGTYLERAGFVGAATKRMEFLFVHADPESSIRLGILAVGLITLAVNGLPPGWVEKKILAELRELLGRPARVDELVDALRRHLVHPPPEWAVKVLAAALGEPSIR
jgi:hypothetical protein